MKRILVISPHADDGELWCGASMARWARDIRWTEDGCEDYATVTHICLSAAEGLRLREFYAASDVLGVAGDAYDIPDTQFDSHVERIRTIFGNANDVLKPDLVVVPPSGDRHQDHAVVHEEAKRAFRFCSLLGFDIPYNEPTNRPTWYQEVTGLQMDRKQDALKCYKSQSHQQYMDSIVVDSLAHIRGTEIRQEYAEAFEVIRWIN